VDLEEEVTKATLRAVGHEDHAGPRPAFHVVSRIANSIPLDMTAAVRNRAGWMSSWL
jgi:hypothetical protein